MPGSTSRSRQACRTVSSAARAPRKVGHAGRQHHRLVRGARCAASSGTKLLSPEAILIAGTSGVEHGDAVDIERRGQEQDAGLGGGARQPCVTSADSAKRRSWARRAVWSGPTRRSGTMVWNFTASTPASAARPTSSSASADIALVVVADLGNDQHLVIEVDGPILMRRPSSGRSAASVMMQHELRLERRKPMRLVEAHGRRIGRLRADAETARPARSPTPLTAAKPIIARAEARARRSGATADQVDRQHVAPALQRTGRNPATAPACSATTMPSPRLPAKKLSAHAALTRWASQRGDLPDRDGSD